MKSVKNSVIIFLILFGVISFAADKLVLAEDGKSDYTIVVPDGEDPRDRVGEAASALQGFLAKMSGAKLPIVKESEFKGGKAVYLGKTAKSVKAGIPFDQLKEWKYVKRVIGNDIFLAGCDASGNIKGKMEHHDRAYLQQRDGMNLGETREYREWRGTHKAVLSLLDKELGLRFLLPGSSGIYIPELKKVEIPADLNFFGQAAFPYCNGRIYGDRNMTIAMNHNDVPYYKQYGGHSFPVAVSKVKYGKTHPEYFVLVNGVRRPEYGPGGAGHLCVSNPDVQELMMKELERQYADGFRWVQIGQTDGMVACECDNCQKLGGGDKGELLWKVYRRIALEMKTRRPDLKIVFLVYSATSNPPKSFDEMPDNVMLEMCIWKDYEGFLKKWEKFKDVPKIAYIYFWGAYNSYIFSPCRHVQYLADNLRIMKENNFFSIFKCGWASSIGMEAPAYYVFSRLLEDPYQDPHKLLDEFCEKAYGKAAGPMKQFFRTIDQIVQTGRRGSALDELEVRPRNISGMHKYSFSPYRVTYLGNRLWYSTTLDQDPLVQARLQLVRKEFDLIKYRTHLYALSDAFNITRSPAVLEEYEKIFKRAVEYVDSLYDKNGRVILVPGLDYPVFRGVPKNVLMFGGGEINPSFPPELRNGFAPLKASLKMKLKPSDYKFNAVHLRNQAVRNSFFKAVNPKIKMSSFGSKEVRTTVNVAYDRKNIYFHIEAVSSKDPAVLIKASGHDEKFDNSESVNIYLSVDGKDGKYFRFAFNPVANSFAEWRRGYETEPGDPNFGRENVTWNGKWEYSVKYDSRKKVWSAIVTIPYASLGKNISIYPGAEWRMNIVRSTKVDGKDKTVSWVELPEGVEFGKTENFGNMEFSGFSR